MCECLTHGDGARFVDVCCVDGVNQAEALTAALERALLVHHRDAWKSWSPGAAAADPTLVLKLAEVIAAHLLLRRRLPPVVTEPIEPVEGRKLVDVVEDAVRLVARVWKLTASDLILHASEEAKDLMHRAGDLDRGPSVLDYFQTSVGMVPMQTSTEHFLAITYPTKRLPPVATEDDAC